MRKEGNVLWDKAFSEDMDEYWIGAAFIPAYKCSSCIEREYYYADGKKAPLSNRMHETSTKQ